MGTTLARLTAATALMLGVTGLARAGDHLPVTNVDVTLPPGWALAADGQAADELMMPGHESESPRIFVAPVDDCRRIDEMTAGIDTNSDDYPARPAWVPSTFQSRVHHWEPTHEPLDAFALCLDLMPGRPLLVGVAVPKPAAGRHAAATPMLTALAAAVISSDEKAPWITNPSAVREAPKPPATAVTQPRPQVATAAPPLAIEAPAPTVDDEPAPPPSRRRRRGLRIGLGGEYLSPEGTVDSGYGLAVALAYDVPLGRRRTALALELGGMAGVDSSAGFWADTHGHLAIGVVQGESIGLAVLAGAGVDGVGEAGDPAKLHVPYTVSGQGGGRVTLLSDDAVYAADVVWGFRAAADADPPRATRVTLARHPRYGSTSVDVSYLRYADLAGRVSLMVSLRL